MTLGPPPRCRCGNYAKEGRPTCGIVLCLTNNEYEAAVKAAKPHLPQANAEASDE